MALGSRRSSTGYTETGVVGKSHWDITTTEQHYILRTRIVLKIQNDMNYDDDDDDSRVSNERMKGYSYPGGGAFFRPSHLLATRALLFRYVGNKIIPCYRFIVDFGFIFAG